MQNLVITNAGQELITSLITKGTTASFTKIATSEHVYEKEELENLFALEDIKQEVAISKLEQKDASTIEITAAITNEELAEGYYIKALGLYMKNDEGNEILYAVAIDDTPDYLSAFDNKTISSIKYRLNVRVSNSEQVTLEIDPKVYATAEQIEELSNSVSEISKSLQQVTEITTDLKPHAFNSTVNNLTTTTTGYALDATQGKALNTRVTALETPTFTQASSRTNIASGNTMPTILGKIMKYFTDLKTHAFNSLANNLTTTTTGYALDATQGKTLNDKFGKVLWTNTNPVAFDTMTITLSSDDYDMLDIYYLWSTTSNFISNISMLKGYSSIIRQVGFDRSAGVTVVSVISRTVNRSSDTVFTVDNFVSTDAVNYTNNYFIPIKVIGRKLS